MQKFLIVDDEPVNCRLLKEFLADKACCDIAYSGHDALKLYATAWETGNDYDLMLLDVSMPEMDGLEVLERIRRDEESRGIKLGTGLPIIILTAVKDSFMSAFKKGAEEYILKPVNRETLISKIDEQLQKRAQD